MQVGEIYETKNCGKIEIIEYKSYSEVKIWFIDTGFVKIAERGNIRKGQIRDPYSRSVCGIGYLGCGKHKACGKTKGGDAYSCWSRMIKRCYSKKSLIDSPTYNGVNVCDSWLNFQNFAEWYYDNYPTDGRKYDLDKDIVDHSAKLYSPSTCIFVSRQENSSESASRNRSKPVTLVSPDGKEHHIVNLKKFCKESSISYASIWLVARGKRHSHKGWTLKEVIK